MSFAPCPAGDPVDSLTEGGTTMKRVMLAVFGGCLLLASASPAQDRAKDKGEAGPPATDEQFVLKASEDGLAEVNHGTLAAQRAGSPAVKEFAQRMVKDHTKANAELTALADKKGLKVARDMGEKHKAMQEQLSRLAGAEFDRHYMQHMVEGHEKAVALFEAKAKDAKDDALKAFAAKTLPTLQEHLSMARQVNDKVKGGK
jgi:putative membrane protein